MRHIYIEDKLRSFFFPSPNAIVHMLAPDTAPITRATDTGVRLKPIRETLRSRVNTGIIHMSMDVSVKPVSLEAAKNSK